MEINISTSRDVEFPLHLRIPGWCRDAQLEINGESTNATLTAGSIHIVKRVWKDRDNVTLLLPMRLSSSSWFNRSVSIERGPLVFALDVPFDEREVVRPRPAGVPASAMHRGYIEYHPIRPWNFAIPEKAINDLNKQIKLDESDVISLNPWSRTSSPIQLTTYGVRLPQWRLDRDSAANPPLSPVEANPDCELQQIRLIPYGATTLRIAEFPVVHGGASVEEQGDLLISASHVFEADSLAAIHDGSTADTPRHTFWPHRGSKEWLQYSFTDRKTFNNVELYWYDDTGRGACRARASWKLLYRDGDTWKDVNTSDSFTTKCASGQYRQICADYHYGATHRNSTSRWIFGRRPRVDTFLSDYELARKPYGTCYRHWRAVLPLEGSRGLEPVVHGAFGNRSCTR